MISEAKALDDKGRCCGRKPLVYKRAAHYFCDRCDRAFSFTSGKQIQNWAYLLREDGKFETTSEHVGAP